MLEIESNDVKIIVDSFPWMTSKTRCDFDDVQKNMLNNRKI